MTRIRVGIGGWTFAPWRGVFYPAGLPQARELDFASRHVSSIEINGTFYGTQKPASFRRWRDETPAGFVFAVKGPRFATHRRELGEAGESIARFFASGVGELGDKLGPVLWQLPATARFDEARLGAFLALLPERVGGMAIRHVVEARHPSFADDRVAALLRRHNVALALIDAEGQPQGDRITADFVYARLKRAAEDEPTGYAPQALDDWRDRARGWAAGQRDCFIYFINGAKVRAPAAAMAFIALLEGGGA